MLTQGRNDSNDGLMQRLEIPGRFPTRSSGMRNRNKKLCQIKAQRLNSCMVPQTGKNNRGYRNICQCKLLFFFNQMTCLAGRACFICLCDGDTVQKLVNIQEKFSNDNETNKDTVVLILNGEILRILRSKNELPYLSMSLQDMSCA